jgi:hypothetical protein
MINCCSIVLFINFGQSELCRLFKEIAVNVLMCYPKWVTFGFFHYIFSSTEGFRTLSMAQEVSVTWSTGRGYWVLEKIEGFDSNKKYIGKLAYYELLFRLDRMNSEK